MADALDDRRHCLDNEDRGREDQADIEKIREKLRIAQEAKAGGVSSMRCPRCDGSLKESEFEEVLIDTCEKCGGVWLDSGELEQLTQRDTTGWFSRLWFSEG